MKHFSPLSAAVLAAMIVPVFMKPALAQSDEASLDRAVSFLSEQRLQEALTWAYPLAQYKSFSCPRLEQLEQRAFKIHCRIIWTTLGEGYTNVAFNFNRRGTFIGTVSEGTDSAVKPFSIVSQVMKSTASYLSDYIDQNRDKFTEIQKDLLALLKIALRESNAEIVMDIKFMVDQLN